MIKQERQDIDIYKNIQYFFIYVNKINSYGSLSNRDLDIPVLILAADIDDQELGRSVRQAFKQSTQSKEAEGDDGLTALTSEEGQFIQTENKMIYQLCGLKNTEKNYSKNFTAHYKTLTNVFGILIFDSNQIKLTPTQTKRNGFTGFNDGSVANVIIDADSSDELLGKAVQEAFARCKSVYQND